MAPMEMVARSLYERSQGMTQSDVLVLIRMILCGLAGKRQRRRDVLPGDSRIVETRAGPGKYVNGQGYVDAPTKPRTTTKQIEHASDVVLGDDINIVEKAEELGAIVDKTERLFQATGDTGVFEAT